MEQRHSLVVALVLDIKQHGWLTPEILSQAGVLALAFLFGIICSILLKPVIRRDPSRLGWLGEGVLRIVFPVVALLTAKIGMALLGLAFAPPFRLIAVADVLLLAMLNITVLTYLLGHVFQDAPWVPRWERRIGGIIWLAYALHVVGILPEIADALDDLSFHLGHQRISVLTILQGVASIAATMLVAMWLSRLIERRLMQARMLDASLRVMLTKISQTLLVVIAVVVALPLVGVDPSVLSVFGGALGVGLGLGLQKIASNYVSGFIILLDRSIRMGDMVQIADRQGVVTRLTARYIVLKSLDGTEALVPNDTLVTSTVVNQSYTDPNVFTKMTFAVGYESDLDLVLQILVDATRDIERIVQEPSPRGYVDSFGDSAVNVSVGFWLKDPENGSGGLKSDINLKVWRAFREHQINIPFNRLDVVHFEPSSKLAGDGNLQGVLTPQPSASSET
ncbi:mechanosensitive ion channel family protein [Amantichitinum ursilacus]|uniref:Mechanosensitive channel MscK n=1 Tax=Amantichitinum ursilacus TaxID=857265 RepID=A0A0N0GP46_9NEIS|nr:mechanosensitive ion channel domain-containing protein [Amantichitinum ursilacus]KPC53445.1 Mechanosensitive channel MscK precursor [Amantichitinum ursilacus]